METPYSSPPYSYSSLNFEHACYAANCVEHDSTNLVTMSANFRASEQSEFEEHVFYMPSRIDLYDNVIRIYVDNRFLFEAFNYAELYREVLNRTDEELFNRLVTIRLSCRNNLRISELYFRKNNLFPVSIAFLENGFYHNRPVTFDVNMNHTWIKEGF